MPEIPDRLPGEIIAASHPNVLRQRSAQRYADDTARDSSVPLPDTGEPSYITGTGLFEIYDGTDWIHWISEKGGIIRTAGRLQLGELDAASDTRLEWFRLAGGNDYYSRVGGRAAYFQIKSGGLANDDKAIDIRLGTGLGDADAPKIQVYAAGDVVEPILFWNAGRGWEFDGNGTFDGHLTATDNGGDNVRRISLQRAGFDYKVETQGAGFDNVDIKYTRGAATGVGAVRYFSNDILGTEELVWEYAQPNGITVHTEDTANGGKANSPQNRMVRNILVSQSEPSAGDGEVGDVFMRVIAP